MGKQAREKSKSSFWRDPEFWRHPLVSVLISTLVTAMIAFPVGRWTAEGQKRSGEPIIQAAAPYALTEPWRFIPSGPYAPGFNYFIPNSSNYDARDLDSADFYGGNCWQRHEVVWKHKGSDAGETWMEVFLTGNSENQVSFTNLRVQIISNELRPAGVAALCNGDGGGGSGKVAGLLVDLDAESIKYVEDIDTPSEPTRVPTYTLDPGEQAVFYVFARVSSDRDIRWQLLADQVVGKQVTTLTISDGGKPFRTTGMKGMQTCVSSRGTESSSADSDLADSGSAECPSEWPDGVHS